MRPKSQNTGVATVKTQKSHVDVAGSFFNAATVYFPLSAGDFFHYVLAMPGPIPGTVSLVPRVSVAVLKSIIFRSVTTSYKGRHDRGSVSEWEGLARGGRRRRPHGFLQDQCGLEEGNRIGLAHPRCDCEAVGTSSTCAWNPVQTVHH